MKAFSRLTILTKNNKSQSTSLSTGVPANFTTINHSGCSLINRVKLASPAWDKAWRLLYVIEFTSTGIEPEILCIPDCRPGTADVRILCPCFVINRVQILNFSIQFSCFYRCAKKNELEDRNRNCFGYQISQASEKICGLSRRCIPNCIYTSGAAGT